MTQIALFSDDTTLRDMLNQIDGFQVAYFSTELDTNQLPKNISLAIFDFDIVPLSLLDEWEQFPRLHLRKMAVVSVDNLDKVDEVLGRLDSYTMHPLSASRIKHCIKLIFTTIRLSEFANLMRSELKNPLTSIKGYSDIIQMNYANIPPEQLLQFIQTIGSSAIYMRDTIDIYSDWIKLEHGRDYSFRHEDFTHIIEWVEESLEHKFINKNYTIVKNVPENLPQVMIDNGKVYAVLESILNNSINYSDDQPKIDLQVTVGSNILMIEITDNGVGISDGFKPDIFQPLERNYLRREIYSQQGHGMSLYLAKQIIEMHGGDIWFESEVGVGTTFYFTLPLVEEVTS